MVLFFTLESGMHQLLSGHVPELANSGILETILMGGLLLIFGAAVFIQIVAPVISATPFSKAWAIHLRNGLYVNTVFDRTVRSLYSHGTEGKSQVIERLEPINHESYTDLKQKHRDDLAPAATLISKSIS
jgi:NAD(P)H-quinone oxidoreductase subunit 5